MRGLGLAGLLLIAGSAAAADTLRPPADSLPAPADTLPRQRQQVPVDTVGGDRLPAPADTLLPDSLAPGDSLAALPDTTRQKIRNRTPLFPEHIDPYTPL